MRGQFEGAVYSEGANYSRKYGIFGGKCLQQDILVLLAYSNSFRWAADKQQVEKLHSKLDFCLSEQFSVFLHKYGNVN